MVLVTSYSTSPVKTIACSIGTAWLSTFVLLRKGMFFFCLVCLHNSPSGHILVLSHFHFFFPKSSNPQLFIFNNVQVKLVFKPSFEMLVAISTALQSSNVHKGYNNSIILIHEIHKLLFLSAVTVLTACVVVQGKTWHWFDCNTGRLWVDSCANTSYSVQQCWNVNTKYDFLEITLLRMLEK